MNVECHLNLIPHLTSEIANELCKWKLKLCVCCSVWKSRIDDHYWYHGSIDRSQAETLVLYPGDFLVRDSLSREHDYVITCNWQGYPTHFAISRTLQNQGTLYERAFFKIEEEQFDSIPALIHFYVGNKQPLTRDSQCIISKPVNRDPASPPKPCVPFQVDSNRLGAVYQAVMQNGIDNIAIPEVPDHIRNRPLPELPLIKEFQLQQQQQRHYFKKSFKSSSEKKVSSVKQQQQQYPAEVRNSSNNISFTNINSLEDGYIYTGNNFNGIVVDDSTERADWLEEHEYCDIDYEELLPIEKSNSNAELAADVKIMNNNSSNNDNGVETNDESETTTKAADSFLIYDAPSNGAPVDMNDIELQLTSRIHVQSYTCEKFPVDLKPMDCRIWPEICKNLLQLDCAELCFCLNREDVRFLSAHACSAHPLIPVDLSLLLLPQGDQFRKDIIERCTTLKYFIIMSILNGDNFAQRVQLMVKWIEISEKMKNSFDNFFAFNSIIAALSSSQVTSITSHWSNLRTNYTACAVTYESKLRRMYVEKLYWNLNWASNEMNFKGIPELETICHLFQPINEKPNESFFDHLFRDDEHFGLESILQVLLEARKWKNVQLSSSGDQVQVEDPNSSSFANEMFQTEFQIFTLWGIKGCLVNSTERLSCMQASKQASTTCMQPSRAYPVFACQILLSIVITNAEIHPIKSAFSCGAFQMNQQRDFIEPTSPVSSSSSSSTMGSSCVKKTESIDNTEDTSGSGAYHGMNRSDNGQRCHQKFRSLRRLEPIRRESQHSGTFYYAIATLADATHDVGNITQTLVHLQTPWSPYKDPLEVEALVRKAKAEMKTISVANDCLFVDYRFVCHLPPNAKIRAS
ncbi:Breast cancer anti-estrogen resistance protein 3 [Trichinella spiralis]|uniref:Breast cancer anti-estrogen resistance protein 3 n=1 Tax=Trichinella spiralis TaxID=6334 RepID=A0A0V1BJ82_TRISP|nr:Breast cancer anti-estrogen resistance protein 3 [Trichinella spiralis]